MVVEERLQEEGLQEEEGVFAVEEVLGEDREVVAAEEEEEEEGVVVVVVVVGVSPKAWG